MPLLISKHLHLGMVIAEGSATNRMSNEQIERLLQQPLGPDKRVPWSELGQMRDELRHKQVGERIFTEVENRNLYRAAKEIGIKITRRKLPMGGWVYERIA